MIMNIMFEAERSSHLSLAYLFIFVDSLLFFIYDLAAMITDRKSVV